MKAVCVRKKLLSSLGFCFPSRGLCYLQSIGLQLSKEDLHMLVRCGANEIALAALVTADTGQERKPRSPAAQTGAWAHSPDL